MIERFYRLLTKNAEMMTYEKENGAYKRINYKFLGVIAEELKNCDAVKYDGILLSQFEEEKSKRETEAKNKLQE